MASSWERLANTTLSSTNANLDVTWSNTKQHLKIIFHGLAQSANSNGNVRVGTAGSVDASEDYIYGGTANGGADNLGGGATNEFAIIHDGNSGGDTYGIIEVINITGKEKLFTIYTSSQTSGAGNAPSRVEIKGKYVNSAQINFVRFYLPSNSATYASGSSVTVWGADDQGSTPVYPNLTNGTIFEESDTGKHYMFDGTSAWNEI